MKAASHRYCVLRGSHKYRRVLLVSETSGEICVSMRARERRGSGGTPLVFCMTKSGALTLDSKSPCSLFVPPTTSFEITTEERDLLLAEFPELGAQKKVAA